MIKMVHFKLHTTYYFLKKPFAKHADGWTNSDHTLHLHRGGRGRGPVVVGGYAGVNPTVLGHEVADLQGDFPRITRDTGRRPESFQS